MKNDLNPIAISIVIAGIIIAGAIFMTSGEESSGTANNQPPGPPQPTTNTDAIRPISSEDHIIGDPNAPVKIVEYSDYECPFCKRIHQTLQQIMDEYGKDGQVAWVYRHFPLDQLHPVKALRESTTAECVNELGGNTAFWQFTDRFYELTPSNNQTDLDTVLPQIIGELGLSQSAIDSCVASGKYDQHIQDDINNAIETGGRGTPWSIVVAPNGKTFPLSGAQPYNSIKQLVDLALQEK
jgi:protein-disulfide isomerase